MQQAVLLGFRHKRLGAPPPPGSVNSDRVISVSNICQPATKVLYQYE